MPLPLLLIGAAVAFGGYGVKKGLDAKEDFERAEYWNNEARKVYDKSTKNLEKARKKSQESLESLGEQKFHIYEDSLIPFSTTFEKIKNINFDDSRLLGANSLPVVTKDNLNDIKEVALAMQEVVGGGITAIGAGGLTGLAVYGGAATFGAASTGTAIAGLGGVAATNATLAWLGGGALSAGGMGMAGGMAVLGGIVAGPVLAVGGMMIASKAEEAKYNAYANHDKAELAAEQMKTAEVATKAITKRITEIFGILDELNDRFIPMFNDFKKLVDTNKDYNSYSEEDKKGVFMTASLIKTIKTVMEAPLIDKDGVITQESRKALTIGKELLDNIQSDGVDTIDNIDLIEKRLITDKK